MLNPARLHHAVDLQQHSYRLLRWTAKAIENGFLHVEAAHNYFSLLPDAAKEWLVRDYENIPPNARPVREDVDCFSAFFSTYLENSFDLVANPGKQLYSPDNHCFCLMCSWLVNAPNLKTKRVTSSDKRHARNLTIAAVQEVATRHDMTLSDEDVAVIVDDPAMRETVALVAYGYDLLKRMQGIEEGPAVLALWRGFAWTETGSPKKGFRLEAEAILDGEKELVNVVRERRRPDRPRASADSTTPPRFRLTGGRVVHANFASNLSTRGRFWLTGGGVSGSTPLLVPSGGQDLQGTYFVIYGPNTISAYEVPGRTTG